MKKKEKKTLPKPISQPPQPHLNKASKTHQETAYHQLATIFQMTDGEVSCVPKLCPLQICSLC